MSLSRNAKNLVGAAGLLALMVALVPLASADLDGPLFRVDAFAEGGAYYGYYEVNIGDEGTWQDGDNWYFVLPEDVEIYADGHPELLLGTLQYDYEGQGCGVEVIGDPQVNLSFSVQSGGMVTDFQITSGFNDFSATPIPNAYAQASASVSVADFVGDGATFTGDGDGPNGNAYLADYNGMVPTGTMFVDRFEQIVVAPGEGSNGDSFDHPGGGSFDYIGYATDMSAEWKFTLTPYDVASGSSQYSIIPEPAALWLLAAGVALLRRR